MPYRACVVVLLALALVAPVMDAAVPRAVAQDDGIPLPVAGVGQHPRLLITTDYIDATLRPRMAAGAPAWTAFAAYVVSTGPEEDAAWTAGTALRSLAAAWLVTGERAYADRGKAIMVSLVNRVESHAALAGAGGLDGALLDDVAALALGYDWLHGALTDQDRAHLRTTLLRASDALRDPARDTGGLIWLEGRVMAFGNTSARWLWALSAVGLALWGEDQAASGLLDFCRDVLTGTIIPALDIQTGGAWAEGPVYGFIANWATVQTALAWWTARGENVFDDTEWWYDRLAYDLFLYHPAATRTYNQDWGDPMHDYPAIIGDAERYHAAVFYGRAQDLLLRTVFAGTPHADWMDWFLRQPPDAMPGWMAVEEFLWRDPDRPGYPPLATTWIAPYSGHVFMRSRWAGDDGQLDPSATYVSFVAGDRLAYHQFYDQGSFTIFHDGRDLVVRSGVYSGDGTSEHDANYFARTIAANAILICDLAENFDGIRPNGERDVWLNDCGQRTMNPVSRTAINVDYLIENWRAYDTGSLIRSGEIGDITYLRADITGAYNSTVYATPENRAKAALVVRELVYWRPNIVIVADRVVTTYPTYTPLLVFHFQTEPVPSGLFFRSQVNTSVVYMQNLLPNSQVTMVPGYEVAGQTIDQSWGELVRNTFEEVPYGPYRLEVAPGEPALDNWFLTAFVMQGDMDPPPAEGLLVVGENVRGVVRGAAQVMFDAAPGDGADVTEAAFTVGAGVTYVLVTGLQPGAEYSVQAEGRVNQTLAASEAGLLLIGDLQPGTLRLALVD
ncbi:MAG: hypothetical protein GX573_03395 [Chloroflexi bacterium]|nr:hypothetical protein [Chloroflexota bacterium]